MQDAYTDVGGRQCLEHIVEQLQVHLSLFAYMKLAWRRHNYKIDIVL